MAEPTENLGLARPNDGVGDWGDDYREAMAKLDQHPGIRSVLFLAEVTDPWIGQVVYEVTTGHYYGWSGSVWAQVLDTSDRPTIGFRHDQAVPSNHWVIPHPLSFSPNVTTVDSSGREVEGEVRYSPGQVEVFFSAPFAGSAYLS